jgi:hypothetical protein
MIFAKEGRKHTGFLKWLGALEEDFIPGMLGQSIIPMPTMKGPTMLIAVIIAHSLRACSKLLTDHQLWEAEEEEASVEEGSVINQGSCTAFFVARTKVTQRGRARSRSQSKRKLLKPRRGIISRSRSSSFGLLSIHPRIRRQPTAYDFCSFSKSLSSLLGSITPTPTNGACPKLWSAARRAPLASTTTWPSGAVWSSHS